LRANSLGFDTLDRTDRARPLDPGRLAILATLWFVFETFVGEKHLFASSKNELRTTLSAFQDLIVVFHRKSPIWTFGLRIVCFYCPGHNKFPTTAGRTKALDRGQGPPKDKK
jgi:hypothetical protein